MCQHSLRQALDTPLYFLSTASDVLVGDQRAGQPNKFTFMCYGVARVFVSLLTGATAGGSLLCPLFFSRSESLGWSDYNPIYLPSDIYIYLFYFLVLGYATPWDCFLRCAAAKHFQIQYWMKHRATRRPSDQNVVVKMGVDPPDVAPVCCETQNA